MSRRHVIPALFVSVALLAACGSSDTSSAEQRRTIILTQDVPTLTNIDSSAVGNIGGQMEFIAPLFLDGQPYGTVIGSVTNIGTATQGRNTTEEEKLSLSVYDLPGGQISVMGRSYYDPQQREIKTTRPVTRAFVGGTAKYIGARGEVRSTRNADGTYTQRITLID